MALSFIEVAAECGVHAIKFQTHLAEEESTPREPWRIPFSPQDASRYDYWQRLAFTLEQWALLKAHAERLGLVFLSSPFSLKACDWLESLGMVAWKLASGEVRNPQIVRRVQGTGKPLLLSSGLSTPGEILTLAHQLTEAGSKVAVFHCTSQYPTSPEQVGLNLLSDFLQAEPQLPVGLSDHSASPVPGIVATYLGASLIEVHLTLHPRSFGPDVTSSLTPEGLKALVAGVNFAWRMRQAPVDKAHQLQTLGFDPAIFGRSWVTTRALEQGTILRQEDVAYKKPAGGLSHDALEPLLGRRLNRSVLIHHVIGVNDVD